MELEPLLWPEPTVRPLDHFRLSPKPSLWYEFEKHRRDLLLSIGVLSFWKPHRLNLCGVAQHDFLHQPLDVVDFGDLKPVQPGLKCQEERLGLELVREEDLLGVDLHDNPEGDVDVEVQREVWVGHLP